MIETRSPAVIMSANEGAIKSTMTWIANTNPSCHPEQGGVDKPSTFMDEGVL